jgi:hypothetical protein
MAEEQGKSILDIVNTLFNDNYSPSDKFDIILNEIFSNKVDSNKQSLIYSFQISNLITPNQKGQILDVGIKYKYRQDVINNNYGNNNQQNSDNYINYVDVRKYIIETLEKQENPNQYWEVFAKDLGDYLYKTYYKQVSGWEIKLTVLPHTQVNNFYEPGLHGPIYTIGDIY